MTSVLLAGAVFVAACGSGDGGGPDASIDGGNVVDAMSGEIDASIIDGGVDAMPSDAMPTDAMPSDAMPSDAMPSDAMAIPPDAMAIPPDAMPPDAMPPDAMPPDAGSHPIGPLGAGLSTLVGFSDRGYVDGPRDFSLFNNPVNVEVGPQGNVYVADFDNGLVRKVTPAGVTTTLVQQANFQRPFGIEFSSTGVMYVQTDRNSLNQSTGALWSIDLVTGVATLAMDDIGRVRGLGGLSDGRLALADAESHTIRIYDPILNTIADLAGSAGIAAFADGTGALARFNRPLDIVVTPTDEIYVADSGNHRIRHVTLAGVVTTVAGSGIQGAVDGAALTATLDSPAGLAFRDDVLYFSEFGGLVRTLAVDTVTTVAGSIPGFADNDDPLLGRLFQTEGIDIDDNGIYIYIADGNGGSDEPFHRVRRLEVSSL